MNAFVKKKQDSDNALENYFLELVVQKKTINREVGEILEIIEKSSFHREYKTLLKRILFGHKNLYFENWGTLQDGLLDAIKTGEVRENEIDDHGIVIDMIVRLIEMVFDIPDESMYDFVLLEQREEIEHSLVALMKRMLDHLEVGLKEMVAQSPHLTGKKDSNLHPEYIVLQKNLSKLPNIFFETDKDKIATLKQSVYTVYHEFIEHRNLNKASFINFSE